MEGRGSARKSQGVKSTLRALAEANALPAGAAEEDKRNTLWLNRSHRGSRFSICTVVRASLVVWTVKNPPAMQESWAPPLGREDPLEEGLTTLQ